MGLIPRSGLNQGGVGLLTDVSGWLAPQQQFETLVLLVHAAVMQGGVPPLSLLIQVTTEAHTHTQVRARVLTLRPCR